MPVPNVQYLTPDDGQRNCPKHVEFRTRINLEVSASVGLIVKKFVTIHGHMNIKEEKFCFKHTSQTLRHSLDQKKHSQLQLS